VNQAPIERDRLKQKQKGLAAIAASPIDKTIMLIVSCTRASNAMHCIGASNADRNPDANGPSDPTRPYVRHCW
jgi:hypothetical protein